MGTFTVIFSKPSQSYLEKIVFRIAKDNPQRSESFGIELLEKALSLELDDTTNSSRDAKSTLLSKNKSETSYLM